MSTAHLLATYQRSNWTFVSTSSNGYTSWTNLVLLSQITAISPELVIIDPVNDDATDFRKATCEALIRKILTAFPDCRLILMKFAVVSDHDVDASINTPTNSTSYQQWSDLATHYGMQLIDVVAGMQAAVAGGTHLNTLLADTVHPTVAGHTLAYNLLQPYLNDSQDPIAPLPARLYALSEDYENTPTTQLGTDDTSRSGTWSENGTQVISSEAGATITYTATCQSFAIYRADGLTSGVEYSVDAGSYLGMNDYPPYGWPISAGRASHTVTFRVISGTLKIDQVWFI